MFQTIKQVKYSKGFYLSLRRKTGPTEYVLNILQKKKKKIDASVKRTATNQLGFFNHRFEIRR